MFRNAALGNIRFAAALFLLTLALVCAGRPARAQLSFTLPTNPLVINTSTGGSAIFTATLTNNNPYALYLNSDDFTVASPATLDDTRFQNIFVTPPNNAPQPTLAANGGTMTVSLFEVALPARTTPGIYSGTITLQGGQTQLAADNLATAQFAVQSAPVPEAGTLAALAILLGLGAGRAALTTRRKPA